MNILTISDVDGTLLNTSNAIHHAQAQALGPIMNISVEEAKQVLAKEGLQSAVENHTSYTLTEFLKGPYKTPNPYEISMPSYPDADDYMQRNPVAAVSNSDLKATVNKFLAQGIYHLPASIHAEYGERKKPGTFLAEQAIEKLDRLGLWNIKEPLVHIGDQEYDIQFGNTLQSYHPNVANIWINRNEGRKINSTPDYVVSSFDEIYKVL